ncbi:MAG: glycosyltransferase family 4 protein [Verrucomicrobia bacterium]|nr:glycosyltransferase family 4 protein [Verrucomicrobiota bacterium]
MKRIFINAFACDPEKGSEPGIGWTWVSFIAKRYPTHLVTAEKGRNQVFLDAIQSDPELAKNLTVTFLPWKLPGEPVRRILLRYYQPYYYVFYRQWLNQSFLLAEQMCSEGKLSLVHHCTYMSFRDPGDFWKLPVPSVWGPAAGTNNMPLRFLSSLGAVEGLKHTFRNSINQYHKKYNRSVHAAVQGYSRMIAASANNQGYFHQFREVVDLIPCNLVSSPPASQAPKLDEKIHLCFSCLHLSRKGGAFLIEAFAKAMQAGCSNLVIDILGNGVMTSKWKALSEKLGCDAAVNWHGFVPRDQALALMQSAHVFVFPSLADVFPTVIAEAFSHGLPVITTDVPGVGDMVNNDSGWILHAGSPKQLVQDLADTLIHISKHPEIITQKRAGVQKRAREFLFEERMKRLEEIYEELLSSQ